MYLIRFVAVTGRNREIKLPFENVRLICQQIVADLRLFCDFFDTATSSPSPSTSPTTTALTSSSVPGEQLKWLHTYFFAHIYLFSSYLLKKNKPAFAFSASRVTELWGWNGMMMLQLVRQVVIRKARVFILGFINFPKCFPLCLKPRLLLVLWFWISILFLLISLIRFRSVLYSEI